MVFDLMFYCVTVHTLYALQFKLYYRKFRDVIIVFRGSINLVPRPSLLFLPCRRGERPWLRLVTCLCIQIKAAPGVGPQLNFSTGQFNSV